jgi:restriction system protein
LTQIPYAPLLEKIDELQILEPIQLTESMVLIPDWHPWQLTIKEPELASTKLKGFWSFLNLIEANKHKEEQHQFEKLLAEYNKVKLGCEYRNRKIESLHQEALKKRAEYIASEQAKINADIATYNASVDKEKSELISLKESVSQEGIEGLYARIDLSIRTMSLPGSVSRSHESKLDLESGVLIHEHEFPDISSIEVTKDGLKTANQTETKKAKGSIYPALALRLLFELSRLDTEGLVKSIVINGWTEYTEKNTGQTKLAYCLSVMATKEQISALVLSNLDPIAAFRSLKGITIPTTDIIPIAPIMRLNKEDKRFVEGKDVLDGMSKDQNLAAMDWEDFEHLCRELFEKAFSSNGSEVKITQASRDQGVDAIVFDNDPLRGGKIVIQAKRYTNLVDVSSVRDLYGTVINEGAVKGILVTTSHFGSESYSFAKDKPITLINGNELLGLLSQYGYRFRIDIEEAKKILTK